METVQNVHLLLLQNVLKLYNCFTYDLWFCGFINHILLLIYSSQKMSYIMVQYGQYQLLWRVDLQIYKIFHYKILSEY